MVGDLTYFTMDGRVGVPTGKEYRLDEDREMILQMMRASLPIMGVEQLSYETTNAIGARSRHSLLYVSDPTGERIACRPHTAKSDIPTYTCSQHIEFIKLGGDVPITERSEDWIITPIFDDPNAPVHSVSVALDPVVEGTLYSARMFTGRTSCDLGVIDIKREGRMVLRERILFEVERVSTWRNARCKSCVTPGLSRDRMERAKDVLSILILGTCVAHTPIGEDWQGELT